MLLRNIFMLISLLIVLVAGYGTPKIQFNGHSIAAGTSPGRALRQAINLAIGALVRKLEQSAPGEVVTAEDEFGGYKVSAMYSPSSSEFGGSDPTPPTGPQLANGLYNLIKPTAGWLYEYGYCALKTDNDCTTGIMTYQVAKGELKRNTAPGFANSSFTTAIHYLPRNETLHAKIIPSESSTQLSLCKRDDNPTMTRCASMDTLIAGYEIKGGTKLYSSQGFYMEFQDDQNICSTHPDGRKYWCAMTQNTVGAGPFTMSILGDGKLLFNDKNNKWNGELPYHGPNDFQYRLTMQNDGNLVLYRGMDNSYPIWASHQGNPPFGAPVDAPCTGKFIM